MKVEFKGQELKRILKSMSDINELCWVFDEEGLKFTGFDPSFTKMYDIRIEKDRFEFYDVDGVESFFFDKDELNKIFQRCSGNTVMSKSDNGFDVSFDGREFTLYELSEFPVRHLPDVPYQISLTMSANVLKEVLKDIDTVGSGSVYLETINEEFIMNSKDALMAEYHYSYQIDMCDEVKVLFSLVKLSEIADFSYINDTVELRFGNDTPLILLFEDDGIRVMTMIAPILEG